MTSTLTAPATTGRPLRPHPDRLLPAEPGVRTVARDLYERVRELPIYSPHGHVPVRWLSADEPFGDPAQLLVVPDHYVLRLLHAHGVGMDALGRGPQGETDGRAIWRLLCEHWDAFAGTPVRYWFETQLSEVFGLTEQLSAATADRSYDQLAELLTAPEFRPRALFDRFRIRVLATTDDPADDLSAHAALAADPDFTGHVLPTFRADRFMRPEEPGFGTALAELAAAADQETDSHAGMLAALRIRRRVFAEHGGTATDTGVLDCGSTPLDDAEAERIHAAGRAGTATAAEATAYRHTMLFRLAEMAAEDGLVMQLHPGVLRNHHQATYDTYGADMGADLPDVGAFTRPLSPILDAFGTDPAFRLVLFTVDETAFSREIGPLAGFYPSVYAGAPWWFIDTPAAIGRYRRAVTDSAGLAKTSGFIDDTRAFCSIPARHDMSRRCDASYLAELVSTHQLDLDEAERWITDLTVTIPRTTFNLPE